jgi:hypothetical protein
MFRLVPVAAAIVGLAGCSVPVQRTELYAGPQPVTLKLTPPAPASGQMAELSIESPGADSIIFASANGVDRYFSSHAKLYAWLGQDFGDSIPMSRFAVRYDGQLLGRLMKPAVITVCRQGSCDQVYHEIPVLLPEENLRSVEVTAAYNTVFARRSIRGGGRTDLFREVLSSGVWSVQAEAIRRGWNARVQGWAGRDNRGLGLDLSRMLKRSGELSYGLALHLDANRSDWLPVGQSPALANNTVYSAGIGPALMLRGITASSQLGSYSDGARTLQIMSTRISINGNLTEVRMPVSINAEKIFAFGGGAIVSRRREAIERLTGSIHLLDDVALSFGLSARRSAWPNDQPADDLQGSETLFVIGAQYSLSW